MSFRTLLSRFAAGLILQAALFALSMATLPPVNAQDKKQEKGTLKGRILDAETEQPLPFANVVFLRVTRDDPVGEPVGGAMGREDGTYSAELRPGSYTLRFSYVSYATFAVERVFVSSGETTTVDGRLSSDALQMDVFEVKGRAIRNAEGSMLVRMKQQATVSDAITSDLIGKTGDSHAGQALERMSGVSLVGSKYVYVRGLGERYSSTQVNGSSVGTPEANKRVVPLDLFPSGVLDNIIVQKTYSPDMPADFGGGVVNINTRDFVEGSTFSQSLSLGYAESGTGDRFMTYRGGTWDWLGFDDGSRALPDGIDDYEGAISRDVGVSTDDRSDLTKQLSNVWTPSSGRGSPPFSYSGVYSRGLEVLGRQAGFLASASLSNHFETLHKEENTFRGGGEPISEYDVTASSRNVLGGLTGSMSLRLADEESEDPDRVKINLLYTRSADDLVKIEEGPNDNEVKDISRNTSLSFIERGLFQGVVQGTHTPNILDGRFDWSLGYSEASRNEPDRRRYRYARDTADSVWVLAGQTYPFERLWGEGHHYSRDVRLDWTIPTGMFRAENSTVKMGYAFRHENRDSEFRTFGFTCQRGYGCVGVDRTLVPEDLIAPDSLENAQYVLDERTAENDSWVADQTVNGAYLMLDTTTFPWLRSQIGVRYENSDQSVLAASPYSAKQAEPKNIDNQDHAWLPAMNLTWTPGGKANVRMAYSKTVNRPELRELSPFQYFNFDKGWVEQGNDTLGTAAMENYDLRLEYYSGPGELLAVGLFYKDFDRPIQKALLPLSTGFKEQPLNGENAELMGYETEVRLSFATLWDALDWLVDLERDEAPASMYDFSVLANYSRIDSNTEYVVKGETVETPFTGQAEHSLNFGLFHRHGRWESSVLYKSFGRRLALFGLGANADLYEDPAAHLDLSLAYQFSPATRIKFSAKNLLDEDTVFAQDDLINQRYSTGSSFGVSVSYSPPIDGE